MSGGIHWVTQTPRAPDISASTQRDTYSRFQSHATSLVDPDARKDKVSRHTQKADDTTPRHMAINDVEF